MSVACTPTPNPSPQGGGGFVGFMRFACAALLSALLAVPASAAEPWLAGNYGNAAGCAFAQGGTRDNEDMLLLTAEKFETYAMLCEFVQVLKGSGASVATALCGHEGEDLLTARLFVIRDPWDADARTKRVTDADGNPWAEVPPCE